MSHFIADSYAIWHDFSNDYQPLLLKNYKEDHI